MSLEILGQDPEEAPCSIDGFGDANRTQLEITSSPVHPGRVPSISRRGQAFLDALNSDFRSPPAR